MHPAIIFWWFLSARLMLYPPGPCPTLYPAIILWVVSVSQVAVSRVDALPVWPLSNSVYPAITFGCFLSVGFMLCPSGPCPTLYPAIIFGCFLSVGLMLCPSGPCVPSCHLWVVFVSEVDALPIRTTNVYVILELSQVWQVCGIPIMTLLPFLLLLLYIFILRMVEFRLPSIADFCFFPFFSFFFLPSTSAVYSLHLKDNVVVSFS